jgi:hypothetical protein
MSGIWTSSALTSEFRHEYEAERERWLRRRFLWYTGVVAAWHLLGLGAALFAMLIAERPQAAAMDVEWASALAAAFLSAVFLLTLRYASRHRLGRDTVLWLAFWLIMVSGAVELALGVFGVERALALGTETGAVAGIMLTGGAASLLPVHLLACLFLPWTPRESFRPLVPLLALYALVSIWYAQNLVLTALVIAASPLIGAPGALICWWRYSRFHDRFNLHMLRRRYTELKRDLVNAREIHEALFPAPVTEGPVRLAYRYEPMRQIGGDYLYVCQRTAPSGGQALNVVLIDVTGHGIPAALTVNRLHGELERIYAEQHTAGPGEVLRLLNRYVHLTLISHSVYATAFCVRIDPDAGTLEYASAGHPPAFLRAVDGTMERLDSTTFVLGVTASEDFQDAPRTLTFGPGDALIVYTDGATDVRDRNGRFLGVVGLQQIIASARPVPSGGWPGLLLRAVDQHRQGAIADDTLVVEISRPLQPGASAEPKLAGVAAAQP